jgi:peptidoglycan/LPS O-acetylase OafA/YrhL
LIEAPQKSRDIRYRPDIDGLRAVAVMLVIGFHMRVGLPPTPTHWIGKHLSNTLSSYLGSGPTGGFIGVDIFFVISGFLISGILIREQAANTFSITRFYERRVRRIFPALTAVLSFTLVVGSLSLIPSEAKTLAQSTIAAIFSGANIYFWKSSGYFDLPALQAPLIHTWSLAVEEQFYLVFPVALYLLHRFFPRHIRAAVLVLFFASFAASVIVVRHDATAAFYLPHTRAWELLAGTIVALGIIPPPSSRLTRNLASFAGLLLIVFAAFCYTSLTRFPGESALLPCLGAALIIVSGTNGSSVVGRILSAGPIVFIGFTSYSLYLWHWPLLVINNYEYFPGIHFSKPWLFLIMFLVAVLSWRFVEQPFRSGALKLPRRELFIAAATAATLLTAVSAWAIASNGIPSRFTPAELNLARYSADGSVDAKWGTGCFAQTGSPIQPHCLAMASDRPNYLLFGDSHAAHLWYGLSTIFPEIHFLEATGSSCKPLVSSLDSHDPVCKRLADDMFDHFLPTHHVDVVILSSIWTEQDRISMGDTVSRLNGMGLRVYVVGPDVLYDQPLPDLLIKAGRSGDPTIVARHLLRPPAAYDALDRNVGETALTHGAARYISLRADLCPADTCLEYASPGVPLQFDAMHLTSEGSILLAQRFKNSQQFP